RDPGGRDADARARSGGDAARSAGRAVMPRFLVKICGVTTPEDAALVVAAGADAIGVNLWSGSKRFVEAAAARDVLAAVPDGVLKVGVFVDAPVGEVEDRIDELGLDRVQLHGDESPAHF